jgi:GT2 family glycosyltransferase
MLDISIIIVNWNVKDLLRDALKSIYANTKCITFEVIVVDNDSKDNSVEMIRSEFPEVLLTENKYNAGFTKANNQGMAVASGKNIMFLNPDTELVGNSIKIMNDFMAREKDCGALGCKLLNTDGSLQRSCKTFPTLETFVFNALFLDSFFPKSKIFGKHFMTWWNFDEVKEVDQPMGSALMVKREVIDKVGMFDQNIFIWFDEVDLCYRIKKSGWKIYFTPEAQIKHHLSKSFKQWKSPKQIINGALLWRKSRNYFFKKHYGSSFVTALVLLDVLQITLILAILYALIRYPLMLLRRILWRA